MLRDVSWLALRKCTSEKLGLVFLHQPYIKRKIMHAHDLDILVILVKGIQNYIAVMLVFIRKNNGRHF